MNILIHILIHPPQKVASALLPGTYGGRFGAEAVDQLPDGRFSFYGFDNNTCKAGSFCKQGQKTTCPQGFVCPTSGLSLPQRCTLDVRMATSCAAEGLTEPFKCRNGTICSVPYVPPLPSPPGYKEKLAAFLGRGHAIRVFEACQPGEWCGLGRSESEGNTTLCPGAFFCPTPAVIQPLLCDMNGTCTVDDCPVMPYCPNGTTEQAPCPAGWYCSDTSHKLLCDKGSYCAQGSSLWLACPVGYVEESCVSIILHPVYTLYTPL